jgi:multiple sugar transport system permease protein
MARETLLNERPAWGRLAVACLIALLYFAPVFWMILAAFKSRVDIMAQPPKFFFSPTFDNYWAIFHHLSADGSQIFSTGFERNIFNSVFIAAVSVSLALALGALAAYGFSRLRVPGRDYYMFYVLALRMMPPLTLIVPLYLLFRLSGLGGSYVGIILVYTAFNLPFSIWMLRSFLDELNTQIEEAAWLDGCSHFTIFLKICLPQISAGIAATAMIAFVFTWNDFLFSLLLTGQDTRTVPVAMVRVVGADVGVDWGVFAAIGTIYLAPILVVVFVLQRHLLRGATFGTLSG